MMALLTTETLTVDIDTLTVCQNLNITINAGESWAVLGRNGVGKTTLLLSLAGLHPHTKGSIKYDAKPLTKLSSQQQAQHRGLLLQQQEDNFPCSVFETALIGRHPHLSAWQWESDADKELTQAALKNVGLDEMAHRCVTTLSGGERQRLALAQLFTQDPELMLLDEPSNHLDMHHQISCLDYLRKLANDHAKAIVMTLHDVNLANRFCDHALLLFGKGESLNGPINEILTSANLERLYQHPVETIAGTSRNIYLPA